MSDEKPSDILSKVLSYVDSPFKLFALILMAVFCVCWVLCLAEPRTVDGRVQRV
jgi:hypothetical protein